MLSCCFQSESYQFPLLSILWSFKFFDPLFLVTKNLLQDELKKKFRLWGGKEKPTFGEGRRGGIPALVGEAQGEKWVEGSHRLEKMAPLRRFFVLKGSRFSFEKNAWIVKDGKATCQF